MSLVRKKPIRPDEKCASCGERLDQHNLMNPCPRFVVPPRFSIPQPIPPPGEITWRELDQHIISPEERRFRDMEQVFTRRLREYEDMLNRAMHLQNEKIKELKERLAKFERSPQAKKLEPLDYVAMFDADEDGLEEGYRGWPTPKERIIF